MIREERRLIPNKELFGMIEELLRENYQVVFTVTGNSMWPLLRHGQDCVVVEKCLPSALKKGDIILFSPVRNRYLLHRITSLREYSFETTGDGNCFRDGYFPRDTVIARVVKVIRSGKTLDMSALCWKVAAWIWMVFFPLRAQIIRILKKWIKHRKIIRHR